MRLGASHHALTPPIVDEAGDRLHARTVETVERTFGNIAIELRAVEGGLLAVRGEALARDAFRIGVRLHEARGHRADDRGLGDTVLIARGVMNDLAADGGMNDMDGVLVF